MKKLISLLAVALVLTIGFSSNVKAQEETTPNESEAVVEEEIAPVATEVVPTEAVEESKTFHQVLKEKYIEGGAGWMTPILLCLIIGLALVIERIIYLNLASTNTKKIGRASCRERV